MLLVWLILFDRLGIDEGGTRAGVPLLLTAISGNFKSIELFTVVMPRYPDYLERCLILLGVKEFLFEDLKLFLKYMDLINDERNSS